MCHVILVAAFSCKFIGRFGKLLKVHMHVSSEITCASATDDARDEQVRESSPFSAPKGVEMGRSEHPRRFRVGEGVETRRSQHPRCFRAGVR